MRAAGRIFLGVGAVSGDEERVPTEAEQEKSDRPRWLMPTPCTLLLMLALFGTSGVDAFAAHPVKPFIGSPQPTGAPAPLPPSLPRG